MRHLFIFYLHFKKMIRFLYRYVWIIVNLNLIFYSFLFYVYNISFEKKKNCIDKKNIESKTLKNIEYIEK